jgi:hypothetical protein
LAQDLTKVGPGGGLPGERGAFQEVPLGEIDSWLQAKVQNGTRIDPKVDTVLYFFSTARPNNRLLKKATHPQEGYWRIRLSDPVSPRE